MDELTLRYTYAAFFFIFIIISSVYRIKATNKGGDAFDVMKKEGISVAIPLRLVGFSLTIGSLIFIFYPSALAFANLRDYNWFFTAGIILCIISFPYIIWTFQSLGKNITETVETRKSNELVTTGIYKYLRHPIYTTTFFYNCGLAFIAANWLIGTIAIALFVLLIIRTSNEEKILIEKYGDDYRNYMKRTGGHFPKLF